MRELFLRFLMERLLNRETARQIVCVEQEYDYVAMRWIVKAEFANGRCTPVLHVPDDRALSIVDVDDMEKAIRRAPNFGEWQAHCFMVAD